MSFTTQDDGDDVMSEINMTPLVDVMLVLLIAFMITVPVLKHAIKIDLPRASHQREQTQPDTLRLSVDAQGHYYWNTTAVDEAQLPGLLRVEAAREPQPQLHIRAHRDVRYERVAQAMAAAQQAGLRRIGFVTDPQPQS